MPPGVVYTTFHYPLSGANVVTTEWSDWATNCPEYKVTAVQVTPGHSVASIAVEHPEHRLDALVRMANQIARQYTHQPDDDAVAAVAAHLTSFWEHEMRADLARAVEGGTARVDSRVAAAVARLPVAVNGASAGRQSGSEPVADQVEPVSL
jgi:formate dehydrogenase major subunit